MENKVIGWNELAEKTLNFEAKIKDVCESCNGGVLSMLDGSGKEMLERSGVLVHNYTQPRIEMYYDYDLLLRWLLKLSFNSARMKKYYAHLFEKHIEYILDNKPRPQKSELSVVAYMAKAESIKEVSPSLEPYMQLAEGSNLLNPFLVRFANAATSSKARYNIRGVFFGPLMFFLVFFDDAVTPRLAATVTRDFVKKLGRGMILDAKKGYLNIPAGQKSWLDLYEDQVLRAKAHGSNG